MAKPRVVTVAWLPDSAEGKSRKDGKNKQMLAHYFNHFRWSSFGFHHQPLFFLSGLELHYLSHPCHIQGNTLRGFDILTATEDGHNLQRHSTQADRQAGIAKAKQ